MPKRPRPGDLTPAEMDEVRRIQDRMWEAVEEAGRRARRAAARWQAPAVRRAAELGLRVLRGRHFPRSKQ